MMLPQGWIKISFTTLIVILIISCQSSPELASSDGAVLGQDLWVDATAKYLPQTAEWTNRVEVADLNGDGWLDLLFANGGNYSEPGPLESSRAFVSNGGDAPFTEITDQVFDHQQYYARVIKVSDLNQDSIPDILIGTTFQTQSQLLIGLGDGVFENRTDPQLPAMIGSIGDVEFGDVDRDGDLDIILADWGPGLNMNNAGGRTMLWLNDGQATFTNVTDRQMPDILIQFSWDLEFIDFDNDFDLDIAVSCKRCGTSRLFENDGTGHFVDKRGLPAYTNNYDFEVMDVNQDGLMDMVTINDGEIVAGKSWSRREHIFLNEEGKRFKDGTEALWPLVDNIGEDDNNISFLDFDSDGDPDFLVSSLTGEDRLLVNDGSGKFKLVQPVLQGDPTPHTLSLVLADLNQDGKLDIVMGQGEGEENLEERIFLGNTISRDTAPPIISHLQAVKNETEDQIMMGARIYDHKTPNMPYDWQSVVLSSPDDSRQLSMSWYGEHLWQAAIADTIPMAGWKICATDWVGNQTCRLID